MAQTFFLFFLLGVVVAVCWIILPLAIVGTKPLLRQILAEQRATNQILAKLTTDKASPPPSKESLRKIAELGA